MLTLITNIGQLLTLAGPTGPRSHNDKGAIGLILDGAVLVEGGRIVAAGPKGYVLSHPQAKAAKTISAHGAVITPGFVDAHTHPVFISPRLDDFERRLKGKNYADIALTGGGILWTVNEVRGTKEQDLVAALRKRVLNFLMSGTTTIEAKSGYGLDLENEIKMLRVLKTVSETEPLEIIPTFLGAHALPGEMRGRKEEYVRRICEQMIPRVAAEKLATSADIFCEEGYFDLSDLKKVALAAKAGGLSLKVHSEQMSRSDSVATAVSNGASSVDHLDFVNSEDIATIAASKTIACLVPGSNYFLSKPYPPARRLLDGGAAVALATDFNPGTCPCLDMRQILSIACTQMNMTPAEAFVSATINAAYATGIGNSHGSLETGKVADLVCHDVADYRELAYYFGTAPVRWTMKKGNIVFGNAA